MSICIRCGCFLPSDDQIILPVEPKPPIETDSVGTGYASSALPGTQDLGNVEITELVLQSTVVETYSYVYTDSRLTQETVTTVTTTDEGTETTTDTLDYFYGVNGPTMVTWNDTDYYYLTNAQGDIVALLDESGNSAVQYTYDAWGNPLSTTGSMADTLGSRNSLRYRGYVFDTETGLYYLQSRYFNPQMARFINADALVSTGQGLLGNNMFAYCMNNPISYADPNGACPHDAKFYSDGPFQGCFQYNPDCQLCAAHGEFWVDDIYGNSYDLSQYESHTFTQMAICTDGGENPYNFGSHQNMTAYRINGEYMDPTVIQYVVAPVQYSGVYNGDLALVIDHNTGNFVFAIVGDRGPSGKYNEVSLLVAWDLGYKWADGSKGPVGNFEILYFPQTNRLWNSVNQLADYWN